MYILLLGILIDLLSYDDIMTGMKKLPIWEIYVPAEHNGHKIPKEKHQEWDKMVCAIARGMTIKAATTGKWLNPSTKTILGEKMIQVELACGESIIELIATQTAGFYQQDAIYVVKTGRTAYIYDFSEPIYMGGLKE